MISSAHNPMRDLLHANVRVRQRCSGLRTVGTRVLVARLDLGPMPPEVCDRWVGC